MRLHWPQKSAWRCEVYVNVRNSTLAKATVAFSLPPRAPLACDVLAVPVDAQGVEVEPQGHVGVGHMNALHIQPTGLIGVQHHIALVVSLDRASLLCLPRSAIGPLAVMHQPGCMQRIVLPGKWDRFSLYDVLSIIKSKQKCHIGQLIQYSGNESTRPTSIEVIASHTTWYGR